MSASDDWTVLPHTAPTQLDENLWRVEGALPRVPLRRCMVVARLQNDDLVLHNCMALDEAGMTWLEGLGRPAWAVVPSGYHRMDIARFKKRYPHIQVVCPAGARKAVEKMVAVDDTIESLTVPGGDDDTVRFAHLDGLGGAEAVMTVRTGDQRTLVFNDAIFNLPHSPGLFWFVYGRMMGNAGGPKITTVCKVFIVKERKAYARHLEALSETEGLARVIVAHGDIIDQTPAAVLRELAGSL